MALPLDGVRVLDFGWVNAGAKGARYLSSFGADVIHLEWKERLDILRVNSAQHPMPEGTPPGPSVNRGSSFNSNHSGKWGISLNMLDPKGKELFAKLLQISDIVVENYTANTMENWGFGWDQMKAIKPDLIYIQAPGFGKKGPYGKYRTYGPTAAAVSGLTYQVGLPDRYPCGSGLSLMDGVGPHFIASAAMAALRQRERTGKGVYVDMSQLGPAVLLTGTSIPEYSANGTTYERTGNRSPYTMAAPHNTYRCDGDEKWIVITCHTDEQWEGLVTVMDSPAWTRSDRFSSLAQRYANQDELDEYVQAWTLGKERYELMERLQTAGVPAAPCQDMRDRYHSDAQLAHRGFFVRVPHSEVPAYEVEGHPSIFSDSDISPLGRTGWGAPCYAEHNLMIYGGLLGISSGELDILVSEDVI
ncbi:CoA transferase [Dehalococcoidia bacterium]|nr:CoA transferase [Dehalococcoidia bacterium]